VGETAEAFAARCQAAATEAGDRQVATLQAKYASKLAAAQAKLDTAEQAAERQRSERTASVAGDLIGGLFGGRRSSVSAMAKRASSASNRVSAAEDKVALLERAISDLQAELDGEVAGIRAQWQAKASAVTTLPITLAKSDVKVTQIGLVWIPTGS
jgi:predicted  nucleic acid-binding Zn-ribbon protein